MWENAYIWALKMQKLPGPFSRPWILPANCSLRLHDSASLHQQLSASEPGSTSWPNPGSTPVLCPLRKRNVTASPKKILQKPQSMSYYHNCDSGHRGAGTPPPQSRLPRDQASAPWSRLHGTRHPPEQTPPMTRHPPTECMLGDTCNEQAVCILLECNLVVWFKFVFIVQYVLKTFLFLWVYCNFLPKLINNINYYNIFLL